MATEQLIIFVKNPIPGSVKTRIAREVGTEQAVAVYRHLLQHTQQLTRMVPWHRVVYYADFINPNDGWNGYEKHVQVGADLGGRMAHAIGQQFASGASKVVIIGSDCLDIRLEHLKAAFGALDTTDVVIGPATDGGYYLLGMKQLHPFLFTNMPWSQPDLRAQTERALHDHGLTFTRLTELSDIDEWADYQRYRA